MDAPTFENLDLACAKVGRTIAKTPSDDLHKVATDALAVLEEQGLYATFLYLENAVSGPRKKELAKGISQELHNFLKATLEQATLLSDNSNVFTSLQQMAKDPEEDADEQERQADVFTWLQQMAKDLDKLLLARDLVRQTLVYARYHARVPQESEVRT